jgi:hypothetical protein
VLVECIVVIRMRRTFLVKLLHAAVHVTDAVNTPVSMSVLVFMECAVQTALILVSLC